jgi:hypothetical protein
VGGTIETKTELVTPANSAGNAKMPPRAPEFTPQQQVRKKTVEEFSKVDADLAKQLDNTQRIDGAAGYISERHNNHGPAVKFWQEHLKEWAISQGGAVAEKFKNMVVTDSFASNPLFNELIKTFQRIMNVPGGADGVIGPRTFRVFALGHFDASYGEGAFTKYTSVSMLSEEEYETVLYNPSRNGYDLDYLPGVGESIESYSKEDATLDNIPAAVKSDLLESSKKYQYEPQRVLNAVNKASKARGIPPIIILRIMQQESNFNPRCTSSAGAAGLMQLMPENCRELGVSDPFDIEQNIEAGVRHFSDYYKRQGTIPLALAAYNAGPGNVDKYRGIPPFQETQDYVRKIMGRLASSLSEAELYKYAQMKEGGSDTLHQRYSWDCGPTAHANMFGDMLGLDKAKLAATFRAMQGPGGMSWANPARFKRIAENISGKNIVMRNLGDASPQELETLLRQGWQITGSFKSVITRSGHITNISGVTVENGEVKFINEDPNRKNVSRGLTELTPSQVANGGRQFWAFKVA